MLLSLNKMKIFIILIFLLSNFFSLASANELIIFLESAYKNNPQINAQRENLKAIKENVNISKSKFLPTISLSGDINSVESYNKNDTSGLKLPDSNSNKETRTISVDQKIFQGFENFNLLKKSELEVEQARYQLIQIEQEVILDSVFAYFDLIFKLKNKNFNLKNVSLFERQVETDSARLQKGEITLADLAQSESSLADANAKFIASETDLVTAKTDFERITGLKFPEKFEESFRFNIKLPNNLIEALEIAKKNNPRLIIAKLDYEISKKNVEIQKAQLSPSASINFSKSKNRDFSSTVDKADQDSLKATLTWPITKGGENYFSLKKAKYKREQSNLLLNDVENLVKSDITNAWSGYQSTGSVLNATKAQVEAAEIANEGITLEYESGNNRTTLELIQSRSLLLNASISNAKAKRDFVFSKFKLLDQIGKLTLNNIKNN
ncbi:MAG: outer membrane protein [Pelagibacterales bacterium]|jgi:outer membrane protein|nr:outer membrane protein [Pelagibacterales bacterium]